MTYAVAMLSVHTSPLDVAGRTRDAGGMNVYMRELARELGQRDSTIDIFTRWTHPQTPRIVHLSPNVRVIHIQAGPLATIPKNDLYQHIPAFARQVEAFRRAEGLQYDLVHSHYWLSGVAGMHLAGRWDVPHVIMFHTLARLKQLANPDEPESPLRLEMEQRLVQHVDRIIAATQDERRQIIRSCGATPVQVAVIPCGVDLTLFTPQDRQQAREKLGLRQDQPVLLFVGRLDPFKGPDVLLRAAALMEEQAQVVIVGGKLTGDQELQSLRRLAASLKISQRVHFPGARPQQELPTLYSAADVTVVPSYHESFGMAAVEALACGTPVVATRAGGLMTVVQDGETGYLVPRCPGFFAERLDSLLQQPAVLERMRRAARPSVQHLGWPSITDQVYNLYDDMCSEMSCVAAQ
ncbi:MAG TPA: glycosyltransferase [Ktedonobacteraceae bacterium]|nr:glycosyltransferase [Ktedonobacteraceae bacterium]